MTEPQDDAQFTLYPPPPIGGQPGPKIAKALVKAYQNGTGYVQKSQRVKGQAGYNFAGERDLIKALRPALIEAGITVHVVGADSLTVADHGKTRSGNTMRDVKLRLTVRFLHDSGEYIDVQAYGEGSDTGDKAAAKAATIAYKYALRQTMMVETGDDPDHERPEEVDPPAQDSDPEPDPDTELLRQVKADLDQNGATLHHLAVAVEAEGEKPTRAEILNWLRAASDDVDVARVHLMTAVSKVKASEADGD